MPRIQATLVVQQPVFDSEQGSQRQALASPLSGIMGDLFNRVIIITIGSLCWGAATACFGFSHTFTQVGMILHELCAWAQLRQQEPFPPAMFSW